MKRNQPNQSKGEMHMTTVQKWGNSLGVRIPRKVAEETAIKQGSTVKVSVSEDRNILMEPVEKEPTLEELVSKITPENKHEEIDFGKPQGKERI